LLDAAFVAEEGLEEDVLAAELAAPVLLALAEFPLAPAVLPVPPAWCAGAAGSADGALEVAADGSVA